MAGGGRGGGGEAAAAQVERKHGCLGDTKNTVLENWLEQVIYWSTEYYIPARNLLRYNKPIANLKPSIPISDLPTHQLEKKDFFKKEKNQTAIKINTYKYKIKLNKFTGISYLSDLGILFFSQDLYFSDC